LVRNLSLFVSGIHWREDSSEAGNAVETDNVFGAIGHIQRHPIALLHAKVCQRIGKTIYQPIEFAIRNFAPLKYYGNLLWKTLRSLPEHFTKGDLWNIDGGSKEIAEHALRHHGYSPCINYLGPKAGMRKAAAAYSPHLTLSMKNRAGTGSILVVRRDECHNLRREFVGIMPNQVQPYLHPCSMGTRIRA
jgi:hypothetical protein